jgi:ribosome-associated heat shock protein Hsp15
MVEASKQGGTIRLDKWLWAARFFKTRALSAQAVAGGKVRINGARVKAAREIRPGEELTIHIGPYIYVLRVRALSARRGPAGDAVLLYEERIEGKTAREALAVQLRADKINFPPSQGRPSKRARRQIIRLKLGSE